MAEEGGEYAEVNSLLRSLHFERLSRRASGGHQPDSDAHDAQQPLQTGWHLDTRHSSQQGGEGGLH